MSVLVRNRFKKWDGLQDAQSEHAHDRQLNTPIELHIPQQKNGQDGKDPVTQDGDHSHSIRQSRLNGTRLASAIHGMVPILPKWRQQSFLDPSVTDPKSLLYRRALEEEVHAGTAHYNKTGRHAGVDHVLDPLLAIGNSDQGESNRAFDGDECKAPRLLEDVEPLQRVRVLICGQRPIVGPYTTPRHGDSGYVTSHPERL